MLSTRCSQYRYLPLYVVSILFHRNKQGIKENHIRNISALIPRCLARFEHLRANNISHAVAHEEHRTCDLLFRIARDVRADDRQAHAEAQALKVAEPQRDEPAPFVRVRQSYKQTRTDNTDAVGDHHAGVSSVEPACVLCGDEAADEEREKLHGSTGDLEVLGSESVKAKGFDYD